MLKSNCKWFMVCPMKHYWEKGLISENWILDYCKSDWQTCVRYYKEEHNIYHPDNMMPDGTINDKLK